MTSLDPRWLLIVVTGLVGWIGVALPLRWVRHGAATDRRGSAWIGAGNAFSAGLFLALGLVHLLPESASLLAREDGYPWASSLALAAFLGMLLLEHVLLPDAAHHAAHAHSGEGQAHAHGHGGSATSRPIVLSLALSLHSVLAGLGLGVATGGVTAGLGLLAISVHKATAGMALGLALASAEELGQWRGRLAALFASMTPLGIGVGMVVGGGAPEASWIEAGALALASGTFIYVGAFDLVQDESLRPTRRWVQWLCAVLGALAGAVFGVFD